MEPDYKATALISRYGFIDVQGGDAAAFLQSQLAADISALNDEQTVLTGWHDPKGRVLCCLKVVRKGADFLLALPAALIDDTIAGLGRYVLRSKVTLTDASERLTTAAVSDGAGRRFEVFGQADELAARVAHHREQGTRELTEAEWELGDIRAGLPEVYPETRGLFTAQMLNLDLIGGISFTKGCYPGQEIIARTHNLGRAKRRMHRYVSAAVPRDPGEKLTAADGGPTGQVVRSAPAGAGSESLVVVAVGNPPALTGGDGARLSPAGLPYPLN